MSLSKQFALIIVTAVLSISAHAEVVKKNVPIISYVQYQSFDPLNEEVPITISGQLRVPAVDDEEQEDRQSIPAVLVVHGSGGVDSRGEFYIEALNDAGIATFEIDMWAARGLAGGLNRPPLPTYTVPDAFGALKYLSGNPNIDADRIAILGFSWGGVMSMLAATNSFTKKYGDGLTFAAYVAHYPVCWAYNIGIQGMDFNNLTGNPVLIQIGELDDYDEGGGPCKNLIASLEEYERAVTSINVYRNAYHAWDRLQPAITVFDPFSHLGQGGDVEIVPSPGKAFQSRRKVVRFFQESFDLKD